MRNESSQPPKKPGQQPEHHADHERKRHRHQPDDQRDARAVDHGRENVAALVVGAEQVLAGAFGAPCRRQPCVAEFERREIEGVVRGDPSGEQRADDADQRNERRHDRHRRSAKAVADIAVEPAG
jgi:hypothetical protein